MSCINKDLQANITVDGKCNDTVTYFIAGPHTEPDMKACAKAKESTHTGIGCFKGTFSQKVKDGMKPYWTPLRCVVHALLEPFMELEMSDYKTAYHSTMEGGKTVKWCNSLLISKSNEQCDSLCNLWGSNRHSPGQSRGPTVNDISLGSPIHNTLH